MRSLVASLVLAVAACNGSAPPADADEALACLTSGRGETYTVGLDHPGKLGLLDFKLMSASPAPPGRDFNTWTLQLSAMANGVVGAPASGATLTVAPYMPDHEHGPGAYRPKIEAMTEPGHYKIEQINTWMPGYWEITIEADAGGVRDSTIFKFCIQA
jgi:hypothetical protein